MEGFWQVSDIVAPSTIRAATAECTRTDCCLSAKLNFTTLAGIGRHYDKNGVLQVEDDNQRTTQVVCRKCWIVWNVTQKGDAIWSVDHRYIDVPRS